MNSGGRHFLFFLVRANATTKSMWTLDNHTKSLLDIPWMLIELASF